jgi:hypothetical protein
VKPDAQPPALTPDDERDLAAVGIVASPRRPGRWDDLRGSAPGDRDLTTTAALRRARRDLSTPATDGPQRRQPLRP